MEVAAADSQQMVLQGGSSPRTTKQGRAAGAGDRWDWRSIANRRAERQPSRSGWQSS